MNILLTGSTSGIGLGALNMFLEEGHTVLAVGRNVGAIEKMKDKHGSRLHILGTDLSELSSIKEIFEYSLKNELKYNSYVHCAGIESTTPLTLLNSDKVEYMHKVNVFSAIEILRMFSKKKFSADGSSVVLMSSVMGALGQVGKVNYSSTKSAIVGVARSCALELAPRRIRVNAISPGVVNSPMTFGLFEKLSESEKGKILDKHPLGIGEIDDITPLIKFLISKESRWITGQNYIIDGGYSVH